MTEAELAGLQIGDRIRRESDRRLFKVCGLGPTGFAVWQPSTGRRLWLTKSELRDMRLVWKNRDDHPSGQVKTSWDRLEDDELLV